ncbi:MAG: DUF2279 domain-containing protein [Flavobacteriales bacterium]|nr:DUF2279 domain-containing protein [Flavobacteriales bacterium]
MKKLKLIFLLVFLFPIGVKCQIQQFPDSINWKKVNALIAVESAFYVGGLSYLQYIWYADKKGVPFHYYNDNKGWLQMDKWGHALTAYKESFTGYYGLRRAGVKKKKALIYGGPLGFFLQAPIEVFDGLYEGWGFSWGDMWANTAGSALLVGQELAYSDQIVKLKMSYQRSKMADLKPWYLGENQFESFFYDYNGHTYWLSANLNRVVRDKKIPDWVNFAVGYSGENMFGEFENSGSFSSYQRYRQYYFSFDIDWTKIPTKYKLIRMVLDAMMIVKLPFPALEYSVPKGFKVKSLYF